MHVHYQESVLPIKDKGKALHTMLAATPNDTAAASLLSAPSGRAKSGRGVDRGVGAFIDGRPGG